MAKRLGRYSPELFILRISLAGSDPEIWRRVEVHSGMTLHELHHAIQCLFDWENAHLYQFHVTPGGKLTNNAMADATRYHMMPEDPIFGDAQGARADEKMIGSVFTDQCKTIVYEYDFGDSWHHLVKIEKRTPGGEQDFVPVCLAGENATPGEDIGGIDGYYFWLDALRDKKHDSHEEAIEFLGEDFDPRRFEIERINQELRRAFRPIPKKPRKKRKNRIDQRRPSAETAMAKPKPDHTSNQAKMREKHEAILALLQAFCRAHLNEEYAALCTRASNLLARKRPTPLINGTPAAWACGIVRAVGWVNFLGDPSRKPCIKTVEIDKYFGVSVSTGHAKSMLIRNLLKMYPLDADWTPPSQIHDNPLAWMVEVNGLLVDVRSMPREVQELAFEKGLIPYVPGSASTN